MSSQPTESPLTLRLWLVERTEDVGYDEYYAKLVRAPDRDSARRHAAQKVGDEGTGAWLDPKRSRVTRVREDGKPGVVLESFNAG